ncbi:hypothetical protein PT069_09415, partial [Erysipelothrix rhusiopathiae]|nr:hypothetical protein [Erysipelothrix rhusiopathiae]
KRVSGVFYNRLQSEMPLQSSVTVCYALYEYETWQQCESNTDILKNEELNTIIHCVGAGVGKDFELKDCNYNKIIIMTDADTD